MITERPGTQAGRTSRTGVVAVGKAGWQNRRHDGLRDPAAPAVAFTPNEKYAALVEAAGYVPVALSAEDYIELLPTAWRAVNAYGVKINYRVYDDPALSDFRGQRSGVTAKKNLWEIHYDPYDVSRIWVRNHWNPEAGWVTAFWKQLKAPRLRSVTWPGITPGGSWPLGARPRPRRRSPRPSIRCCAAPTMDPMTLPSAAALGGPGRRVRQGSGEWWRAPGPLRHQSGPSRAHPLSCQRKPKHPRSSRNQNKTRSRGWRM